VTIPGGQPARNRLRRQSDNHFERLARDLADVRAMSPGDLAEISRIDRAITGRNREAYMQARLDEAMVDSAIRISLTARLDRAIVGYLMASADLGDFGRTEPVAVIDTIGVDPDYAHRGVGHALLATVRGPGRLAHQARRNGGRACDLGLLGFLYDTGFVPSQRIPFVRRLA
jgi:GNAT superfamily N-acetyltransferase